MPPWATVFGTLGAEKATAYLEKNGLDVWEKRRDKTEDHDAYREGYEKGYADALQNQK